MTYIYSNHLSFEYKNELLTISNKSPFNFHIDKISFQYVFINGNDANLKNEKIKKTNDIFSDAQITINENAMKKIDENF